jgi:hypothetical protein
MIKKWQSAFGTPKIFNDPEKIKLREHMNIIKKKIENMFYNKDLAWDLTLMATHISSVIEFNNVNSKDVETIMYSLAYYFLKDYINLKKLCEISKLSIKQLEEESKKSLELLQKSHEKKILNSKEITNKKLTKIEKLKKESIIKFIEWNKNKCIIEKNKLKNMN